MVRFIHHYLILHNKSKVICLKLTVSFFMRTNKCAMLYLMNKENILKFVFSDYYFELICSLVLEGKTLKEISMIEDMPNVGLIYSWTKRYLILKEGIQSSKKIRQVLLQDLEIDKKLSKFDV